MMAEHVLSRRTYLLVFVALLVLTAATVAVSYVELGPAHIAVALAIATVKVLLVALFFMHVLHSGRLVWLIIGAAVLWFGILLGLTFSDYLTRGWLDVSVKHSRQQA
jgi:cytochrome c oxidase subunit 4